MNSEIQILIADDDSEDVSLIKEALNENKIVNKVQRVSVCIPVKFLSLYP